jgi:Ni2+-binding GTPase involved in maturation of urease and hydrogenase
MLRSLYRCGLNINKASSMGSLVTGSIATRPLAMRPLTMKPLTRSLTTRPLYQPQFVGRSSPVRRFSTISPCESAQMANTGELFSAISELNKYGIRLKSLPVITVIGPQSSGKTSVIEALCGKSIFPKSMGMATMKPFRIITKRADTDKIVIGDKEMKSESAARDEIERVNRNEHIKEVDVVIETPTNYNLLYGDMPGLVAVKSATDPGLKNKIKQINIDYVKNPNSIPVVVHAAPTDPETNVAIELVKKLNRQAESFGVITKIDMVERQKNTRIKSLLAGKIPDCSLGYGYCGVILRDDAELEKGMTIEDKMKEDEIFRLNNPQIQPFGVDELKKRLSSIQFQKIKGNIPELLADIDKEITACTASESFYGTLVGGAGGGLTSRLGTMIRKLVDSSIERREFENQLREAFRVEINGYLEKTFKRENPDDYIPKLSTSHVDTNIINFHSRHHSTPAIYKTDKFKELFCFGLLAPIPIDNESVKKAFDDETMLACTLPLFDPVVDDPLGTKRLKWIKYLKTHINNLLAKDNIQNVVHKITTEKLIEYVHNDPDGCDDATKRFAEYVIKEISNEVYGSTIKFSIGSNINIEKRPLIKLTEVSRHLTQIYPDRFTFHGGFFEGMRRNNAKLKLEVFSEPWNEAYLHAVSDNLIDNSYRNVAVNLLDSMVDKLLEHIFDMLNKNRAEKEKNKVNDKINKLNELKKIIGRYSDCS